MIPSSPFSTATAATLVLVACLIVAAVAPGAVAGGLVTSSTEAVDSGRTDPAAVGSVSTADGDVIASDLRSANGTVKLVVRFAGGTRIGTDDGEVGYSKGSSTLSTNDLKTNAASAQADFESFAEGRSAVTVERSFWLANAMLVTVDTDRVPLDRLVDVPGVEGVHENFEVELDSATTTTPGDGGSQAIGTSGLPPAPTPEDVSTASTDTDATYGVEMVRAPEVWETFGTRGKGATVAVIDTGIDPDHPDLTVSGWAEYDADGNLVSDDVSDASDGDGHGTHVAGTVAGGNASGTAIGVAPNASLHGIKVFDDDGTNATFVRVVAGMEHATQDPDVDVLQMSLGADGHLPYFIEPVRNTRSAGKIAVVSAGNIGQGTSSSPGNVYDSLAVGAVNDSRGVADFSSGETINTSSAWGSDAPADWPDEYVVPDVSAPGVSVYSAEPGGTYIRKDGTSMAAPHVSGVAALMLSASSGDVSDDKLYDTLRNTANHPSNAADPDDRYGAGIVDGFEAVSSVTSDEFTVTEFDGPKETDPGATVEASATVTNTGGGPGTGTVEYQFNGTVGNDTTVSLDPGEATTVSFTYVVPHETDPDEYSHGVYTEDSSQASTITVREPPSYTVTDLTTPETVERGGPLTTTVNVTNDGEVAGDNRTVETPPRRPRECEQRQRPRRGERLARPRKHDDGFAQRNRAERVRDRRDDRDGRLPRGRRLGVDPDRGGRRDDQRYRHRRGDERVPRRDRRGCEERYRSGRNDDNGI